MSQANISGEYILSGIHDMASGFKFEKDNTFEFYYIYGAVDRIAKGTYEVLGDTIRLRSQKIAGQDFEIKNQKKQGKGYRLSFTDPNSYLLRDISCFFYVGDKKIVLETNEQGIVNFPGDAADKIFAQHQLFPDIISLIKDEKNPNNYFELALKPSLAEVSFKGIDLFISGEGLTMLPNYFMPFEKIYYQKQK